MGGSVRRVRVPRRVRRLDSHLLVSPSSSYFHQSQNSQSGWKVFDSTRPSRLCVSISRGRMTFWEGCGKRVATGRSRGWGLEGWQRSQRVRGTKREGSVVLGVEGETRGRVGESRRVNYRTSTHSPPSVNLFCGS